ncbi:TetR/AcrR family transcriptional regulator [Caulobacter sp. SL161]|uniref:TetR/AcrR family transcriptional regulator n=1 Tax=Caulobacter sp. SL161 TaxID=2995156 RepID=UPI0022735705|nr:TetR/AcrR family transcriptional regulator [Caulobacter sp. SL161]MCY1647176.1 TetR/AcrR family transcriptional regulator [Caulobacter sp. SL161]
MSSAPRYLRAGADVAPEAPAADGRRRRSQDSRARIVQAMLDLVREGDISPSAELVATRADVGLRTVFRHFKDLESLYLEMSAVIEGELMSLVHTPFKGATWRDRVLELVERRGWAYERIAPFKRASEVLRHNSPTLRADNTKMVEISREILRRQLPPEIAKDRIRFEGIDLLLSFDAWNRLRRDQDLSPKRTTEILQAMISGLLQGVPDAQADL